MNNAQIERHLREHGFRLFKRGKKHALYSDGRRMMPVSYGSHVNPRTVKELRTITRRKAALK